MPKLFPIFLILTLSCANERGNKSTVTAASDLLLQDTLSYSYDNQKEISSYFVGDSVHIDTAYYQITYPIFDNEVVNNAVQSAIFIDREQNAGDAARSFLDAFNEFVEDNNTEQVYSAWYKEMQSKIILNTPLFFTLQTSLHEYTGGAHGNHVTIFSVFDIDALKKIKLEDLLTAGKLKDLTRIAENRFRKKENLADTSSLVKDFFFEDGIFALNDNFGLTKDELVIYYNEYEIKPYSEGITEIKIPYQEILDILNARGKRYINSIKE